MKDLQKNEETQKPSLKNFITFTGLYTFKQEGPEKLLRDYGKVHVTSKKLPPLKISLADID